MAERVTFTASDGVEIVGDYYPSSGDNAAIMLHMMPATRSSWKPFCENLVAVGISCLAIDERGHGESTMNGTLNFKTFSDEEQQAKILDVEAAQKFLNGKGPYGQNTFVIGASIGANLAIQFLQQHPELTTAIALSPGLDYHGVTTMSAIKSLGPNQKIILVASDDDPESAEAVVALHEANPEQTILIEKTGLGHGTRMTDKDPMLVDEIIKALGLGY